MVKKARRPCQRKKNIAVRYRLTSRDDVFCNLCAIFRVPRRFRVSLKWSELYILLELEKEKTFISYLYLAERTWPSSPRLVRNNNGKSGSLNWI
jgi:hypothetical protein